MESPRGDSDRQDAEAGEGGLKATREVAGASPKVGTAISQPEATLGMYTTMDDHGHPSVQASREPPNRHPSTPHGSGNEVPPSSSHAFLGAPRSYAPAMSFDPSPTPASPPPPAASAANESPGIGFQPHLSPGAPSGWTPYWRGDRLVDPRVSDADRTFAIIMHLWWIGLFSPLGILCTLIPVVLWAVRQSTSSFVDDHGREVINMQLTGLILAVSIFGLPLLPFWGVICVVNSIRGAVAAGSREHFRYGMILRPIG